MENIKINSDKEFKCDYCNFLCHKLSDYNRHLITQKHKKREAHHQYISQTNEFENKNIYICKFCEKKYVARNSLWYHEKKCVDKSKINKNNIILSIIEQNNKLIEILNNNCDDKY